MLTLGHLLEALTGYQASGGAQVITDVVIDSRLAIPGALFVALPGERTDGHKYVSAAFAKGAVVALIQKDPPPAPNGDPFNILDLREPITYAQANTLRWPLCLRVEDSLLAMQTLARWWRQRLNLRVIGLTGSVGKTTSKELVAAVLGTRYRTFKTDGSYNNEIGLPLMLLKLSEAHERAVLEMGFYTIGEIKFLCELARPHVGVVNNVYAVHLERAGSLENIVQGKGELVEALPPAPDGIAILNRDDARVMRMTDRLRGARLFTYGLDPTSDLWADEIESLGLGGLHFQMHYRHESLHVRIPLLGRHSVHTALRAAAVGLVEGLTWQEIVDGLRAIGASQLRLVAVTGPNGSLILDDTYNASPESVIAALNLLSEMPAERRMAVLGDMLELGHYEELGHRLVGNRAARVVDVLVTIGPRARLIAAEAREMGLPKQAVHEFEQIDQVIEFLRPQLNKGDVLLLKGSHGLRLDRIVPALEVRP
jgi:UDP-N-acetylmuramoyl-tripeptide--D-alanyl-D-alanine ligase